MGQLQKVILKCHKKTNPYDRLCGFILVTKLYHHFIIGAILMILPQCVNSVGITARFLPQCVNIVRISLIPTLMCKQCKNPGLIPT